MSDRSIQAFVPGILRICDDQFDVLEGKKSILKNTVYEILLAANGGRLNMADSRVDRPAAGVKRKIIEPQPDCKYAQDALKMRDT